MINLFKDVLNPVNWFKLILKPSKIKNLFKRILYYPGLNFGYTKSKIYRCIEIFITISLAKKNKSFQKIFFCKKIKNISYKFPYDPANIISNDQIECLSNNGIIILENVLDNKNYEHTRNLIKSFSNEKKVLQEDKYENDYIKKSLKTILFENENPLIKISEKVTNVVYGAPVKPTVAIMTNSPKKLPEKNTILGDNIFHIDRYLPNIKMFYYPEDVNLGCGHFDYAIGSHKINHDYLNFIKNNRELIFDERNSDSNKFLKSKVKVIVKKNSLLVACTNGFHRRSKFEFDIPRTVLAFLYPDFNLFSLINFKKYNSYSKSN